MTTIAARVRDVPATPPGTPQPTSAPSDGGGSDVGVRVAKGALIAGGTTALCGVAWLRYGAKSRVIDVIDGVELLANPRTTGILNKPTWGVPSSGTVFGTAPSAKVSIEHVDQGALGDCWNIAGMGAIAHRRPEVFEAMVREVGDHIEVALPGRTVRVTRELPLRSDGAPMYGGTDPRPSLDPDVPSLPMDPVFWSAYVEKAQAALARGGYRGLAGGWTKDSFRQLLGTDPVHVASRGTIVDDLLHHLRAANPVAISTPSNQQTSRAAARRMAELNVKNNHYYMPLEIIGEGPDATIRLFNPWGKEHPTTDLTQADLRLIFQGLDTPDEFIRY